MATAQVAGNLEHRLIRALGAARRSLSRLDGRCAQGAGRRGDPADQANHVVDMATHMALRETCAGRVSQWERAVVRFREGLYGICEECDGPIDPARLAVAPDTTRCMHCLGRH